MSLLDVLKLRPLLKSTSEGTTQTPDDAPKPAGKSIRDESKGARSTVVEGEMTIVAQRSLGDVRWKGYDSKLWALTDGQGNGVQGGPSFGWKLMAAANGKGYQAVKAIAQLARDETQWNDALGVVRTIYQKGLADLKMFEKVEQAFAEREKKDADFSKEMDDFLTSRKAAMVLAGKIGASEKRFKKAALEVQALLTQQEVVSAKEAVGDAQHAVKAKESEIAEAKALFAEAFDVVTKVVKQDWEGLATKAISSFGDAFIETGFAAELADARAQLRAAESRLSRLQESELKTKLEAARAGMLAAADDCDIARLELVNGLEAFGRKQRIAMVELSDSKATAPGARMIQGQLDQRAAVSSARGLCLRYQFISQRLVKAINLIEMTYGAGPVGSWLDDVAKGGPEFARSTDWSKSVKRDAETNVKTLKDWARHVAQEQQDCAKALAWLDDAGPKGPEGPFIQAIDRMNHALQPKAKPPPTASH